MSGLLLIISGPSGVGKTTITHQAERELQGVFSVSMTTRRIVTFTLGAGSTGGGTCGNSRVISAIMIASWSR